MNSQTTSLSEVRVKLYTPEKKQTAKLYLSKPKQCLIINPGTVAAELLKEPAFAQMYSADVWSEDSKNNLISTLLFRSYDLVLIDPSSNIVLDNEQLSHINNLRVSQVQVYNISSFYESITRRVPTAHFTESALLNSDLFFVNRRKRYMFLKRAFDITISSLIAPIALALVLVAIIAIKLTSKGPALFVQRRVGLKGVPFNIYKLRTMSHTKEGKTKSHTIKNDSRITPLGKILRKTKIDELPQLHNILYGDMSLIGPRPEREEIVAELVKQDPYYNLRHAIRPGVTGWAQVNNPTATPEQNLEKLEYDLFYVKNASSYLDLKIILKTIRIVLTLDSN
jgi:lipopolysaccharide/colanic/teichoic acid biosynthesis glycosyltransferase